MLHTPLCTRLGIEFPIIQAGMGAFTSAGAGGGGVQCGGWAVWGPSSGLSRTCPSSLPVYGKGPVGPLPLITWCQRWMSAFAHTLAARPPVIVFALGDPGTWSSGRMMWAVW